MSMSLQGVHPVSQDLSVAGKRAGLRHAELGDEETTRSGLFMDQVRIVKEMREKDARTGRTGVLVRPRHMVWENVEGAKTSPGGEHRGEDFAAVIEEIIRVAEPDADIHVRVPDGGWPNAGCYFAEDGAWSLAWRLVDAQFFGTPQRRKRIALLVDFAGLTAPEILFDPQLEREAEDGEPIEAVTDTASCRQKVSALTESVSWDSEPGIAQGEGTSSRTEGGIGSAGECLNKWDVQSKHVQPTDGIAESLYAGECRYGGGESYLLDDQASTSYTMRIRCGKDRDANGRCAGKGPLVQTEKSGNLRAINDQTLIQTAYATQASGDRDDPSQSVSEEIAYTLPANPMSDRQQAVCGINGDIAGTLDANYYKGCGERQGIEREVVIDSRVGVDLYNGQVTGDVAATLSSESCVTNSRNDPYVMEDTVMAAGFSFGQSAKARSLGYEVEKAPTIRGGEGGNQKPVVLESTTAYGICSYESNAFKSSNPHSAIYEAETSRTLDNNGGNPACNQGGIAVVEQTVYGVDCQGGKGGANYTEGVAPPILSDSHGTPHAVCYPIEGNGARPSHFGKGYGDDGDPSFTLNHVEQHGVATYDARGNGDGEVCCTLTGDHQDRVTDYTALVVENDSARE